MGGESSQDILGNTDPDRKRRVGWRKRKPETIIEGLTDPKLLAYATEAETAQVAALVACGGNWTAAGRALGVDKRTIIFAVDRLRKRAIKHGYAPTHDWTHPVPAPHLIKGVSTLYDADGKVRVQWVKSKTGPDTEAAKAAIQDWVNSLPAVTSPLTPAPELPTLDALTVYPIGDHHLGMFAWAPETHDSDHDLARGESILLETSRSLMARTPNTADAVVASVGDFYHSDRKDNRTERGGNALDVDTRWAKVLQVGFRLMRQVIDTALTKHQRVRVVNVPGNHDDQSAFVLTVFLAAWYRNEPRVIIDTLHASAMRQYVDYGATLLCFDHGDKCPPVRLAGLIPTERRDVWSAIKFCHVLRGHIHHDRVIDFPGIKIEHLRVLPPADAWHSGQGYVGIPRDMKAIVFDRDKGEVARYTETLT
jgi:UDP-2,3-diacylglucosamine pyrophosphatase LpxH